MGRCNIVYHASVVLTQHTVEFLLSTLDDKLWFGLLCVLPVHIPSHGHFFCM